MRCCLVLNRKQCWLSVHIVCRSRSTVHMRLCASFLNVVWTCGPSTTKQAVCQPRRRWWVLTRSPTSMQMCCCRWLSDMLLSRTRCSITRHKTNMPIEMVVATCTCEENTAVLPNCLRVPSAIAGRITVTFQHVVSAPRRSHVLSHLLRYIHLCRSEP